MSTLLCLNVNLYNLDRQDPTGYYCFASYIGRKPLPPQMPLLLDMLHWSIKCIIYGLFISTLV